MRNILRAMSPLLLAAAIGGCQNMLSWGEPPARESANQSVVRPLPERPLGPQEYRVRQGDTMYSIAFRNSLDYRELAQWNGIGSDYLIRPGQVLRLAPPGRPGYGAGDVIASRPTTGATFPSPSPRPVPLPGESMGGAPSSLPPTVASSSSGPIAPPPGSSPPRPIPLPTETIGVPPPPLGMGGPAPAPSSVGLPPPTPTPIAPPGDTTVSMAPPASASVSPPPPPPITSVESGGAYRWQWPTNGVVVRGFNPAAGSKGLDFTGTVGQAVVAAAPGKVVYSGSALKGYGELIIIKHDDLRLSAYGYNRTRLVKEGDMVRAGEPIAELGLGPENRPTLHFEIRERGQPVDPVPYLPAKTARN